MTIMQLKTFVSVCKNLSFTQAAKDQFISQPAVSRQMSALEKELGTELFERNHSVLKLTPAGDHLYHHIVPLMNHLEALFHQVSEIGEGKSGHLAIGLMLDQAIDPHISKALLWFQNKYNAQITIHRMSILELQKALREEKIDIAISLEATKSVFEQFEGYLYVEEKMFFCARRDLLLNYSNKVDEEVIARFMEHRPLLVPKLESFPEQQMETLQIKSHPTEIFPIEVSYDMPSIAPMVSAGIGGTFVNESHVLSTDHRIEVFWFPGTKSINKGIFWTSESVNPLTGQFVDMVKMINENIPTRPDIFS